MSAPAQRGQLPGAAGGVKQSPGVRWPGAAGDPTAWPRRWFAWFLTSSRAISGGGGQTVPWNPIHGLRAVKPAHG